VKQLLIDAGNSRLKWRLLRDGRPGRVQALAWNQHGAARAARRVMRGGAGVMRIVVCSVAGAQLERELRRAARAARLPRPLFIRSARRAAGVRNGYLDSWRLGADRWLAMIGARALLPARALCIVDIGTALTIDLLDASGRHRGGLLVPGPALMVDALLHHTAGIRRRAGGARAPRLRRGLVFARSTRAGLQSGSELAAAALIERALREAGTLLGHRPRLLLAGGAAARIAPRLRATLLRADDLVLRGLGVLAAGHSG
jgi:type III pantothenate kinase